ncbi:MAG: peroxide stress protein YaaA [Verrucomicrobiales bacterium]|nr:peroxide stress protein YaaA [Verrucomicrobiales bacterium]
MLAVISPAKTLDFETPSLTKSCTSPEFLDLSQKLINKLRTLPKSKLSSLMSISSKLADLNKQRYQDWNLPFTMSNAKQALMAFKGDVYTGFNFEKYNEKDFTYAQKHLRILSGLYGLLRPLDLIQPYRLEMRTKLTTSEAKDLYAFWSLTLTNSLNAAIKKLGNKILINLASNEYYNVIDKQLLEGNVITPVFKDKKNGDFKVISFYAKKARGAMSDYIIRNRISQPDGLKEFNGLGYRFNRNLTSDDSWVFTRKESS